MRVEVVFDQEARYTIVSEGRIVAPSRDPLPSPPVLFAGSLGACAGVFAVSYLKSRGLPFSGLSVVIEAGHAEEPRRLGEIRIEVRLPAAVEERHLAPIERAVNLCTLKNTLECPPAVRTVLHVPVAASR
ncbi:MAG: OsmC family protein [Acidobacteria bacterium]|nr:OsmC family protein [Acidobacteriota bacterium]